ncbi:MAG: hypothetical protein RLY86_128 [Pseudomonadota bacterium]|jgi:phage virion morphogenesis protein
MTGVEGLDRLEQWLGQAIAALDPGARRQLFRTIGRDLRSRTARRMAAQVGPDGEKWEPRVRDTPGKVRRVAKMMVGLRSARRLKSQAGPAGADIGWTGRTAAIASVHQFGDLDYVDRKVSDTRVRYPVRALLGLPDDDIARVRELILAHLAVGAGGTGHT